MRQFAKNRQIDWLIAGVFAVLIALSFPGVAQPADATAKARTAGEPLVIKLVRNKVTMQAGKEALTSAATAKPGEVLQEVATYTNTSNAALTQLVAKLPVPPNTELVLDSAKPAGVLGSTDGKTYAPLPIKKRVRQANGVETEQAIPAAEYRFLIWQVGTLPAASSRVFTARFKVLDELPATEAAGGKQ